MKIPDSCIALIPARSGSERIKHKNIRELCGHPLIAYTIAAALESGVFGDQVFVSTDSEEYAESARRYGARVLIRPQAIAESWSPDIQWVSHALSTLRFAWLSDSRVLRREKIMQEARSYKILGRESWDAFSILRPTSPFRSADTIRRAWEEFVKINHESAVGRIDSLRAVRMVRERPEKMWRLTHPPYLMSPYRQDLKEAHSQQYRTLEDRYGRLYVQTSSLEMAWCDLVFDYNRFPQGSIAGMHIYPFMQEGYEGFAIDTPEEWDFAEWLVQEGRAKLPSVSREDGERNSRLPEMP